MLARAFLVLVTVGACGKGSDANTAPADPIVHFVRVAEGDEAIAKANADARASVDHFIAELNNPKPGYDYSVKKAFTQGEEVEHMWIIDLSYEGTTFSGVVNNVPQLVTDVKMGDRVSVDRSEIGDWLITDPDGKLHGGYTARALLDTMSGEERKQFEARLAPLP